MEVFIKAKDLYKVGRSYAWKDVLWLGLSGSGVSFVTNAGEMKIGFCGDFSAESPDEMHARIAVFVNEERVADTLVDQAQKEIFVSLTNEEHRDAFEECGKEKTVSIIKLSECPMSIAGLDSIVLSGADQVYVKAPVLQKRKMEFIGDSITCGYGIDLEEPVSAFNTATEDCTKAYAWRVADKVKAQRHLVSFSGYGIITGYTDNDELHRDQLVPAFYDKCGFSYERPVVDGEKGPAPQDIFWDFTQYTPDVVVVNLGTNDSSYCKDVKERLEWYKKDYKTFLQTIRCKYPKADILCCLGLMEASFNVGACRELVEEYGKEQGDEKIYFLEIPLQKPENGLVTDYHPTVISHGLAADLVAKKVEELFEKRYLLEEIGGEPPIPDCGCIYG